MLSDVIVNEVCLWFLGESKEEFYLRPADFLFAFRFKFSNDNLDKRLYKRLAADTVHRTNK